MPFTPLAYKMGPYFDTCRCMYVLNSVERPAEIVLYLIRALGNAGVASLTVCQSFLQDSGSDILLKSSRAGRLIICKVLADS